MSLTGALEELGLGRILQIVSISSKTGVLFLSSEGRDGSVFFRHGQVVRATSSTCQQGLGEVLIKNGVIDTALLRKSLAFQQTEGFRERLGVILVNHFGISRQIIEDVVREQIENVVFSLFAWESGTFRFEAHDDIETIDDAKMDPMQFMLDQGLNPQFLAMEGDRILEESRCSAVGSGNAHGADHDKKVRQPVVVVDDDGSTLKAIADELKDNGFAVHALIRSEDTLVKVDSLYRNGERPVVLVDLIMPKMDGSGVLGGIELLELLHVNFNDLRLIVMTDYPHVDAENKIREMGCSFIVKPRRAEIVNSALMNKFISTITKEIRETSGVTSPIDWCDRFNLGDEIRNEMGDSDDVPRAATSQQSGGLSLLRGMLEELNNPDLQGGVLLLVLRFASEFVNRAIVFTVNDQIVSGFGQFGITGGAVSGDEKVRAIHFPLETDTIFSEAFRTGHARTFKPVPTLSDNYFFSQLGGGAPGEVFIGPLMSRNRIIGFLYGDNLPENNPVGDIEPLAIFLSQAGVSIEKSLLERQLNERNMGVL